jgi:hypothetical protein
VSFDPQNPRGAPAPTRSQSPRYVPPQPQRTNTNRQLLIAGVVVVALLLLGVALVLVFGGRHDASTTPPPAFSTQPSVASSFAQPATTAPTAGGSPTPATVPATPFVPPTGVTPDGAALLAHIPEALRASCTSMSAASSPEIPMASCTPNAGGIIVTYSQFSSPDVMNSEYQSQFGPLQIDPNSGSCEDHATWPAEGQYEVGGVTVGRRLCFDQGELPTIIWTDERLNIVASAVSQTSDPAALVDFWLHEAGPIL